MRSIFLIFNTNKPKIKKLINFFLLKFTFKLKIKSKNIYVKIIIDEKPNLNCGTVLSQKNTLERDSNNIANF